MINQQHEEKAKELAQFLMEEFTELMQTRGHRIILVNYEIQQEQV